MEKRFAAIIFVSLAVILTSPLAPKTIACAADRAEAFDLSNTDVAILNPETLEVIGHAHYQVTHLDGALLFEGDDRFLDGEHDHEVQRVERSAGRPPVLVSYQHSFFHADGSPLSVDALDAQSGTLVCTQYNGAARPDIRQSRVVIPPDTYVGSTQLMLLVGRLREGAHSISMHTFVCLPGPHIIALKINAPEEPVKWPMYPGNLVKVEMVPDFGWFGALAGPLIPKSYGWFDPADDYNYVGGLFDRFYRHRHLMMVRTPSGPGDVQKSGLLR